MSPEVLSLEGRVALVTGAARGIGAATALALAEAAVESCEGGRVRLFCVREVSWWLGAEEGVDALVPPPPSPQMPAPR